MQRYASGGKSLRAVGVLFAGVLWLACSGQLALGTQESGSILALQFRGNVSPNQIEEFGQGLRDDLGVPIASGPLFGKYRIIAFGPSASPDLKERATELIHKMDPSVSFAEIPVSTVNGRVQIPTGELIVQLKPGITRADAQREFSKLKLVVGSLLDEGLYVVRDKDSDVGRLLRTCATLEKSSLVNYAKPNYLELMRRP